LDLTAKVIVLLEYDQGILGKEFETVEQSYLLLLA